ncbi:uncharacterized protein ACA1_175730 [Acanthamoeba castellanii str. Neff]|uniref:Uncharacterized protein n=1 Tax=Acanthamoeba castellanii (strain ATCC 30010 / Neff) TaxID=1257118 RepID=L8HI51_ACACF|nr:uncharacterized protein ACA1_175730 [Acanthamoeba castellanii str. Neff]ELR24897.1 hypothetical protein ACA1_175730 [Acanthamoeba castellanii str. Neff]
MPSTSAERQRSRTMSESQRKAAAAITATCAGPCVGEVLKDRRTGYFYFISPFWVCVAQVVTVKTKVHHSLIPWNKKTSTLSRAHPPYKIRRVKSQEPKV